MERGELGRGRVLRVLSLLTLLLSLLLLVLRGSSNEVSQDGGVVRRLGLLLGQLRLAHA